MKKALSKIIALILCAAMCATVLTACSDDAAEKPKEATVSAESSEIAEAADVAPEADADSDALLYDPSITPMDTEGVAFLSGTWYEMGVQYGKAFDYGIRRCYAHMGAQMLNNIGGSEDDLNSMINAYMDEVKAECPDLYDFVLGVTDAVEDITFVQAAIATVCENAYISGHMSMTPECETISAWGDATADGHLLTATNGDTLVDYTFHHYHPVMVMYPENGYAIIAGSGASANTLINSKGVCMLQSGGQKEGEGDIYEGNASFFANLYALTKCDSADALFEMIDGTFYRPVHGNCHIVDTTGTAFVYENTAAHSAVRYSGDFGEKNYLIANNGYLTDEMASSLVTDGSWDDCPVRYATAEQVLLENLGQIDIGYMNEAIGSRRYYLDGKWSEENWSLGADTYFSSDSANNMDKTTVRMIADVTELTFYRMLGSGDIYNNILPNATSQYFKVVLTDSVYGTVRQANRDASMMIYYASRDLSKADEPRDSYRAIKLNEAKDYFQVGASYAQLGKLEEAKGNETEANLLYSEAVSSFCMAQEYAQNAMIEDNTYMAIDGISYAK